MDDLEQPYIPTPIYFPDSGHVEYVTADVATVAVNIDHNMALLYDMQDRTKLVGVRLLNVLV